ncbi:XRE family transcriptional regulator [Candidatus Dojkabacteria bacterium]|uniref:XRE family transcriptional regulator n=1 Tax=Candidatus Dojkabacteria bacterium TaxID=2099670 RepID=A0A3M0Z2Y1_9BACT|nr:MAG: XRE family transcriptional regulator [Candidatus Dojkabacteria bacterium]
MPYAYNRNEERKKREALLEGLSKKIKMARLESSMSQLEVGRVLGVTDKTISAYESGRIVPPVDKLMALAEIFKKPITYFLGLDPRDYKVASRLRAVEIALRDVRRQLSEIRLISQNSDLDEK